MDIEATVDDILLRSGPMREDDFFAAVERAGIDVGDRAEFLYDVCGEGVTYLGDIVCLSDHVTNGRVFTHVFTEAEAAGEYVDMLPDLDVVFGSMSKSADFAGGGRVFYRFDDDADDNETRVGGPEGWLAEYAPGDLLAFRCTDGAVSVERAGEVIADEGIAPMLRESFEVECRDGIAFCWGVLAHLSVAHPEAFAVARPPITELLQQAGLERQVDHLAPIGFDWDAHWEAQRDKHAADLAEQNGLDELDGRLLSDLATGFTMAWQSDGGARAIDDELLERVAVALTSPNATEAFLGPDMGPLSVPVEEDTVARLEAMLDQVIDRYAPRPPAGAWAALARCAEWRGDALAQEEHIKKALRVDPDFDMAVDDAAHIASERGDARRMETLLDQIESEDYFATVVSGRYSQPGPMVAARNDRCPCGSGRKYKECCDRFLGHDLHARALWLSQKAYCFIRRPVRAQLVWDLALACAGADPDDSTASVVSAAMGDLFLDDVALFEGGGLARFVEERGILLPEDERQLAIDWSQCRHRLWRVDGPEAGVVQLVDLESGEARAAQIGFTFDEWEGDVLLAVVVPVPGDRWMLWSRGVEVAEADTAAVAALVARGASADELVQACLLLCLHGAADDPG